MNQITQQTGNIYAQGDNRPEVLRCRKKQHEYHQYGNSNNRQQPDHDQCLLNDYLWIINDISLRDKSASNNQRGRRLPIPLSCRYLNAILLDSLTYVSEAPSGQLIG